MSYKTDRRRSGSYRFRAQLRAEHTLDGGDEECVELLIQAQEMTERQDDYLFRMGVQPRPDFLQYGLSWKKKQRNIMNISHLFLSIQTNRRFVHQSADESMIPDTMSLL